MDAMLVQYLGFMVAVLILMWAAIEIGKRRYSSHKVDSQKLNTWVKLDPSRPRAIEEEVPEAIDEDEDGTPEQSVHMRAQQNGHHQGSKKPW